MAQRFVVSNLDASVYQSPNGHMDPWYIIGMEGPWKPRYGNKKKSPAAKDPATKLPTFTMWSFQTLNKTCRFFHQNSRVVTCLSFYFLVDAEEPYCCKIVCHSKKIWWYKPYTSINTLLVHFFFVLDSSHFHHQKPSQGRPLVDVWGLTCRSRAMWRPDA
jgi:hypothetical protein